MTPQELQAFEEAGALPQERRQCLLCARYNHTKAYHFVSQHLSSAPFVVNQFCNAVGPGGYRRDKCLPPKDTTEWRGIVGTVLQLDISTIRLVQDDATNTWWIHQSGVLHDEPNDNESPKRPKIDRQRFDWRAATPCLQLRAYLSWRGTFPNNSVAAEQYENEAIKYLGAAEINTMSTNFNIQLAAELNGNHLLNICAEAQQALLCATGMCSPDSPLRRIVSAANKKSMQPRMMTQCLQKELKSRNRDPVALVSLLHARQFQQRALWAALCGAYPTLPHPTPFQRRVIMTSILQERSLFCAADKSTAVLHAVRFALHQLSELTPGTPSVPYSFDVVMQLRKAVCCIKGADPLQEILFETQLLGTLKKVSPVHVVPPCKSPMNRLHDECKKALSVKSGSSAKIMFNDTTAAQLFKALCHLPRQKWVLAVVSPDDTPEVLRCTLTQRKRTRDPLHARPLLQRPEKRLKELYDTSAVVCYAESSTVVALPKSFTGLACKAMRARVQAALGDEGACHAEVNKASQLVQCPNCYSFKTFLLREGCKKASNSAFGLQKVISSLNNHGTSQVCICSTARCASYQVVRTPLLDSESGKGCAFFQNGIAYCVLPCCGLIGLLTSVEYRGGALSCNQCVLKKASAVQAKERSETRCAYCTVQYGDQPLFLQHKWKRVTLFEGPVHFCGKHFFERLRGSKTWSVDRANSEIKRRIEQRYAKV
jgi:hypothetical protein